MTDANDHELLIRIDERLTGLDRLVRDQFATKGDMTALEGRVRLLERIVFGMISVIILSFLGATIAMVYK